MAKAAWCTVNPTQGSGNVTVNVSATAHTGRSQRTTTLTFSATGVAAKTVSVPQSAKAEFVTLNDVSAAKGGGTVTMTGTSNSSKLTFALGSGDISVSLPGSYSAAGASTANAAAIAGDPGAAAQFDFSIQFSVPANTTINAKSKVITVTAAGGQSDSGTISQAAGDPTLSVSPTSVTLDAAGTAKAVTVTSNTNWTVS
jgi:hypothetical protein|nr:MAG TPA: hypothetical protein [Caudoviricetes sp.]